MTTLRKTVVAAALFGAAFAALPVATGAAQAMPAIQPAVMTAAGQPQIDHVRWVCGPWRCHWAPNYYYGGGYGWGRPHYGWGRPHWGWGRRW